MDLSPLKHYLKARDAHRAQEPASASASLHASLGLSESNHLLEDNLDLFLDSDTFAGEVILKLVTHESAKRRPDG
jgi:hypothetical protein